MRRSSPPTRAWVQTSGSLGGAPGRTRTTRARTRSRSSATRCAPGRPPRPPPRPPPLLVVTDLAPMSVAEARIARFGSDPCTFIVIRSLTLAMAMAASGRDEHPHAERLERLLDPRLPFVGGALGDPGVEDHGRAHQTDHVARPEGRLDARRSRR